MPQLPEPTRSLPERPTWSRAFPWFVAFGVIASAFAGFAMLNDLGIDWPWSSGSLQRAESLIADRRFDAAVAEARKLLRERDDDPRALWTLARAQAGAGDLEGSVESLRRIPEWSGRKPDALFFEGKALLQLHRGREAEQAFLVCILSETPRAVDSRLELLALYAMQERFDEFKWNFWSVYPLLGPDDRLSTLTMRMRLEFEQVKPEVNAAELSAMVEADSEDSHALSGLAAAKVHAQDLASAADLFGRALELRPEDPELRERYLEVLQTLGRTDELRRVLEARPEGSDSRAGTQKFLGIVAQSSGEPEAAQNAFRRAAELDPNEPEHRHRLAQILAELGRRDESMEQIAERNRLRAAREDLSNAWADFADTYEQDRERVTVELLNGMARACTASGLMRESEAWASEARRMDLMDRGAGSGTFNPEPAR